MQLIILLFLYVCNQNYPMKSVFKEKNDFLIFTSIELMVPLSEISFDSKFRTISTWSSLNALLYISSITEKTNVLITSSDLVQLETIEDMYNLVESRINGAN
jgi:acyl carrier protein